MIFVLEDDANIRKMLKFALSREGFEVKEFSEAKAMYEGLKINKPKLLLLDIMLPGDDEFSVLEKLRKEPATEKLPVIMLTAKDSEIDKLQGLDGGADDYVTKPFGIAELIARIRAVLRRSKDEGGQSIYKAASLVVDDDKHIVMVGNDEIKLSKKEYDILLLLLKSKGKVCTREEILNIVAAVVVLSLVLSGRVSGRILKPLYEMDLAHPENTEVYED